MNKEELLQKLKQLNVRCAFIDSMTDNPVEIVLFSDVRKLKANGIENGLLISDGGRERIICVFSMRKSDYDFFKPNASGQTKKLGDNLVALEGRLGKERLFEELSNEMGTNWLKWNLNCKIANNDTVSKEGKHLFFKQRIKKRITESLLGRQIANGIRFKTTDYINELIKTGVINDSYKVVDTCGKSSALYIQGEQEGVKYFLKGNDSDINGGINNEISFFVHLQQYENQQDCFVVPINFSRELRWIKHYYIEGNNLSTFLQERTLCDRELAILGDFLIRIVDRLHEIKTVHCDIRPSNFMYEVNEQNQLEKIFLSDFGCCSVNGSCPWDRDTFGGQYLAHVVGGDHRYSKSIIDDAAAAMLTYLDCGGDVNDDIANSLRSRIGRYGLFCENGEWKLYGKN